MTCTLVQSIELISCLIKNAMLPMIQIVSVGIVLTKEN